jgi:DNA replication licensing factor MCM4
MDESGRVVAEGPADSDAPSFSNLDPNTSDAQAMGGDSTRVIWGTNVSIQDTMSSFKSFLQNFTRKYRMWADGMTEEDTRLVEDANSKEYMEMMQNMLLVGTTGLNLDVRNLKAYPSTLKLWHQLQAYPQEIIPLMDQTIKDLMVEMAEKEMSRRNVQRANDARSRTAIGSSQPLVPSSERNDDSEEHSAASVELDHSVLIRPLI